MAITALVWLMLRTLLGGLADTRRDAVADLRGVLGDPDLDVPSPSRAPKPNISGRRR